MAGEQQTTAASAPNAGYINFFEILGLPPDCKPGEVRKAYQKRMKDLVITIANEAMSDARRDQYLLDMARLNAAFFVLRDKHRREQYVEERERVMEMEREWHDVETLDDEASNRFRRGYDSALRNFLNTYLEDVLLEAGRDKECVEASGWDPLHERHASAVLREYRQRLYNEILERLPYFDVTPPHVDWNERRQTARALMDME